MVGVHSYGKMGIVTLATTSLERNTVKACSPGKITLGNMMGSGTMVSSMGRANISESMMGLAVLGEVNGKRVKT